MSGSKSAMECGKNNNTRRLRRLWRHLAGDRGDIADLFIVLPITILLVASISFAEYLWASNAFIHAAEIGARGAATSLSSSYGNAEATTYVDHTINGGLARNVTVSVTASGGSYTATVQGSVAMPGMTLRLARTSTVTAQQLVGN